MVSLPGDSLKKKKLLWDSRLQRTDSNNHVTQFPEGR